jgi:hypothetical protein
MAKTEKRKIEFLWKDRTTHLGMPLSFTKYRLSKDRLFIETGALSVKLDEVQLYRVRDISMKKSLWQRIFGVGTITVNSSDKTMPEITLKNVKHPFDVKEMLNEQVEKVKIQRNVRIGEILENGHSLPDSDGDGIPDEIDEYDDNQ